MSSPRPNCYILSSNIHWFYFLSFLSTELGQNGSVKNYAVLPGGWACFIMTFLLPATYHSLVPDGCIYSSFVFTAYWSPQVCIHVLQCFVPFPNCSAVLLFQCISLRQDPFHSSLATAIWNHKIVQWFWLKGTSGALLSNPLFPTGLIRAVALSSWVLISPRTEILQPVWSPVPGFDPPHCEKFSSYIESLILCLCSSEKCLAPASLLPPVR